MNRLSNNSLSISIACIAFTSLVTAAAATADDAIGRADQAVVAALTKGDKAVANKWLDQDFSWVDSEGIMWSKDDAFRAGLKPLVTGRRHQGHRTPVWEERRLDPMESGQQVLSPILGEAPVRLETIAYYRDRSRPEARFPDGGAHLRHPLRQPLQGGAV